MLALWWRRAERHVLRRAVNVAVVPGGTRTNRMRACDAVRRACRPAPSGSAVLGCLRAWIRADFLEHPSDMCAEPQHFHLRGELPTTRTGPRIKFMSSNWTTRKVDQAPNTEAFANLPLLRSSGRKKTAKQSIPAEPIYPLMPALGTAIQPLEVPGQLRGDRGIPLAKEPTGIVDQLDPLPKNHRQPPRRHPQVPQAGFRATLSGCCLIPRARTPFERSASRSGTNGSRTYQPIELERSPSESYWWGYGYCALSQ